MQRLAPILPALVLLAGCGTNNSATANNTVVTDDTTVQTNVPDAEVANNMSAELPPMTGKQFADTVAASDAYELAAAKLAQTKGTTPAIKDFAAMMLKDHTQSTAELKAAAAKSSITPSPKLTEQQEANLATLRDATGADFDNAYKTQQVAAHTDALKALQGYQSGGDVPALREFAGKVAPIVEGHLQHATGL
jgi:putative membrane protein